MRSSPRDISMYMSIPPSEFLAVLCGRRYTCSKLTSSDKLIEYQTISNQFSHTERCKMSKIFQAVLSFILTATLATSILKSSLPPRACLSISPTWISEISSAAPDASYPNAISSNGDGSFFIYKNSSTSIRPSSPTVIPMN